MMRCPKSVMKGSNKRKRQQKNTVINMYAYKYMYINVNKSITDYIVQLVQDYMNIR